jgi:hypothetical protein
VEAQSAGHIDDAKDWTFSDVKLNTADHSVIALTDDVNITGIATREAPDAPKPDPAKKTFAEQDKY